MRIIPAMSRGKATNDKNPIDFFIFLRTILLLVRLFQNWLLLKAAVVSSEYTKLQWFIKGMVYKREKIEKERRKIHDIDHMSTLPL